MTSRPLHIQWIHRWILCCKSISGNLKPWQKTAFYLKATWPKPVNLFPGSYCRTSSPLVWVSKLAGEGEQRLGTKPEAKAPNLNVRPPQQQQLRLHLWHALSDYAVVFIVITAWLSSVIVQFWPAFICLALRWCLPATRVNGWLWHTWRPGVIYLKGAESPVTVCRCIALPGFQHFKRVPHRIPGLVFGGSASRSKSLKPIQQFCGRTWSSFPLSSGMFWVRRALSVFGNVTSGFAIVDCRWPSMRYIFYRGLLWVSIVKLDFLNPTFSQHEKSFSHWHHLVGGASEKSQKQQNSQQILLLADSVGLYIWRVLEYDTEVAFTLCSVFLPLTWIDLQRVSPLTFALLRHGLVRSVSCQVEKLPPFWSHTGVGVPSRWFVHCQPAMFICLMFLYVFVFGSAKGLSEQRGQCLLPLGTWVKSSFVVRSRPFVVSPMGSALKCIIFMLVTTSFTYRLLWCKLWVLHKCIILCLLPQSFTYRLLWCPLWLPELAEAVKMVEFGKAVSGCWRRNQDRGWKQK